MTGRLRGSLKGGPLSRGAAVFGKLQQSLAGGAFVSGSVKVRIFHMDVGAAVGAEGGALIFAQAEAQSQQLADALMIVRVEPAQSLT